MKNKINQSITITAESPFPKLPSSFFSQLNMRTGQKSLFAEVLGVGDDETRSLQRYARRQEAALQTRAALEAYRTATLLAPEDASNWSGVGRCLAALGDLNTGDAMERVASKLRQLAS